MTKKTSSKLEEWEISLIKAMWNSGHFTKQQIHPYFTKPDRPINQARISQIAAGKIHTKVHAASDQQIQDFVTQNAEPLKAKQIFLLEDPWHAENLSQLLKSKSDPQDHLELGETDRIECKESYSWNSRGLYGRILAGFANNAGGYLLFGIRNDTKQVVGIASGRINYIDEAKMSQFFDSKLTPAIRWEKQELDFAGKKIGVLYCWPSQNKPVICTQDHQNELKEGEVYFRYVGQTTRIRYAELAQVLAERDQNNERRWFDLLRKINTAGAKNVAILNTKSGELSGTKGAYLIDKSVLPTLKFLQEGEFKEKANTTALKLIGTVQAIDLSGLQPAVTQKEPTSITERDYLDVFLGQKSVKSPSTYIRHLVHVEQMWLPVFYFIKQAKIDLAEALKLLKSEKSNSATRKEQQIKRIEEKKQLKKPAAATHKSIRDLIKAKGTIDLTSPKAAKAFLLAVRTLTSDEVDIAFLLPRLKDCFDQYFDTAKDLRPEIRYSACSIDVGCFS